jgi:hypothetical protein
MAALSVDEILQLAADSGPPLDAVAVDGLTVLHLRQPRFVGKRATAPRNSQDKRLGAQIHTFNKSGHARTRDHKFIAPKTGGTNTCRGSSTWRKWTPECVLKAAEVAPTSSARSTKPEGGGASAARQSRLIQAQCILVGQEKGLQRLVAQSRKRQFRYYITNNMMDETKLPFGKRASRKRRCLAWHGQVTWSADTDHEEDEDVSRPPCILGRYTAATMWSAMAHGSDSAGLYPREEALPSAGYHGRLIAGDSHAVNLLTSKVLSQVLPPTHFHVACFCLQHRTGSVCEEVAQKWGLLLASFCLAINIQQGEFYDDLKGAVVAILRKYLFVVQPSDPSCDPDEFDEEECRLCEFAREMLEVCFVQARSTNNADEDAETIAKAEKKRRGKAEDFLRFFPPPWKGVLLHPCPAGCCGPTACHDRAASIQKGADFIMGVIIPYISRPAANRYTKIDPVVRAIALMLNFYTVFKKAIRKLLQGRADNSDDDQVLRDDNALVGAPVDVILHLRKLQANKNNDIYIYIYIYPTFYKSSIVTGPLTGPSN